MVLTANNHSTCSQLRNDAGKMMLGTPSFSFQRTCVPGVLNRKLTTKEPSIIPCTQKDMISKNHWTFLHRVVWICISWFWDLQTTSFEIPWFLRKPLKICHSKWRLVSCKSNKFKTCTQNLIWQPGPMSKMSQKLNPRKSTCHHFCIKTVSLPFGWS